MSDTGWSGHLILLMAPSGSGKSLLLNHVKNTLPEVKMAVSCTTRQMRPGEEEGKVYYFLSREQFEEKIKAGEFLEWAEYGGNLYGTLKSEIITPIQNGEVVLREVEIQGVRSIINLIPRQNLTIIYIEAGDWETLKNRITKRAPISDEELNLRYERYLAETAAKSVADMVVENSEGKLEEAKSELVNIISKLLNK